MLRLLVAAQVAALRLHRRFEAEEGQTTAEYALVLLGAAAIAVLLVGGAT
jgi:Flp pilus assembly pilin Flp